MMRSSSADHPIRSGVAPQRLSSLFFGKDGREGKQPCAFCKRYQRLPKPPDLDGSDEAQLESLIQKSGVYSEERADLAAYNEALVAWPDEGSKPIPIDDILPEGDREVFVGWRTHLLVDQSIAKSLVADSGIKRPYCDPVLSRSHRKYVSFLKGLQSRNLLRWRVEGLGCRQDLIGADGSSHCFGCGCSLVVVVMVADT